MARGDRTNLGPCDCCGQAVTCCACGPCCFSNQSRVRLALPLLPTAGLTGQQLFDRQQHNALRNALLQQVYCDVLSALHGGRIALWQAVGTEIYNDGVHDYRVVAEAWWWCQATNPASLWTHQQVLVDGQWQHANGVWYPEHDQWNPCGHGPETYGYDCCGIWGACGIIAWDGTPTTENWSATLENNHCCKDTHGNCQPGTFDPPCEGATGGTSGGATGGCDDAP